MNYRRHSVLHIIR